MFVFSGGGDLLRESPLLWFPTQFGSCLEFWKKFLTAEVQALNESNKAEASNASRTTRAMYLTEEQVTIFYL